MRSLLLVAVCAAAWSACAESGSAGPPSPAGVASPADPTSPAETVRAYHAALAAKQCDRAEALLTAQSAAITKIAIGGPFQAYCDHPWMGEYTGLTVQRVEVRDEFEHKPSGMWTVAAVLYFNESKVKEETVRLIREGGVWKIMLE